LPMTFLPFFLGLSLDSNRVFPESSNNPSSPEIAVYT
jgi:hypothetical protein